MFQGIPKIFYNNVVKLVKTTLSTNKANVFGILGSKRVYYKFDPKI